MGSSLTLAILVAIAVSALALYVLNRLSSSTDRELLIPIDGDELPAQDVVSALERMGCIAASADPRQVTGLIPGDCLDQQRTVTITLEDGQLRVSCTFSRTQIVGGRRNQEIVERFRTEWDRRGSHRIVDPTTRADLEARAHGTARKAVWTGALMAVVGAALLALTVLVPTRPGASPGSKFYLVAMSLPLLGSGCLQLWAAATRLRDRRK